MTLKDQMAEQGQWLFRWRSYLPLVLLVLALTVLVTPGDFKQLLGNRLVFVWDVMCFVVALIGLALRCYTAGHVAGGSSGRNSFGQEALALNQTGMYSLTRHPLYFANFVVFLGIVLLLKSATFALFAIAAFFLFYERIMLGEEKFLNEHFGEEYRNWASRTPAFFPRVEKWVPPALPFVWQTALVREYHGLFLICAVFFAVQAFDAVMLGGTSFSQFIRDQPLWLVLLALSGALYLAVTVVKKSTNWLVVHGRW